MSALEPALRINNVTKKYTSEHGIFSISLEVMRGEIFGFLGPNGAGKSTTINTILDLLKPDQGTISVLGMDHHKDVKKVHRALGYLAGDMETDPTLTGKQYLNYVAHLRGNVDKSVVEKLITRLQSDITTKIKHLSRGNKQKIGLIAALMHNPDILILDEPTSGLDPLIQAEFNEIIREHKAQGKTTFISSHILSEVQSICDRVGFIRAGHLVHVSSLQDLMDKTTRKVIIHFHVRPPKKEIAALRGIHELQQEDNQLSFRFDGDINQLLTIVASHPVDNIQIAESDLEELFMSYYRTEATTNV
jgi:ABC-2 type transport system ATP-binding protein